MYRRFIDAGLRIIPLYPILDDGACGCGDPDCRAVGKHPLSANWQYSPLWSDEQLETMEDMGQFQTGFGVLVSGLLVIDVDERNGGGDSYRKLYDIIPDIADAGLIVRTGSGGQSKHLYYTVPDGVALVQNLKDYPGIDFKSRGYVVGPGSKHKSGGTYEVISGGPEDLTPAPGALVDLLKKPDLFRAQAHGGSVDVSEKDIAEILSAIPNTETTDYETWLRVGMAIHHATQGTGYPLWMDWSAKGPKHNPAHMERKWGSFGKSANIVSLGTLVHYAEELGGWIQPVTFSPEMFFTDVEDNDEIDTKSIDLRRPPGLVGQIAEWIESQNRHPRENLAVAAALCVVSSVAGMRYVDPLDNVTPNVFLFCVAGSATGKESVLRSHQELLRSAGIANAVHGGIKSEQEIYRNLIRNQAAIYAIDEMGEVLSKLKNARTKATAAYLEGVIGTLMSIYSKAGSFALITGDLKEAVRETLTKEYAAIEKRLDKGDSSPELEGKLERLKAQIESLENGIERPYLNLFGLTTPERFGELLDYEMASTGFIGRAIIFNEREDNPRAKKRNKLKRGPVPYKISNALSMLYSPGRSSLPERVERVGPFVDLKTIPEAVALLDKIEAEFFEAAEREKEGSGMIPIVRRGYELTAKISMVLAMPEGVRTADHVRWAYALIKNDIEQKILLTNSNSAPEKSEALASKIMSLISEKHGETIGRIRNKCRSYRKEDVDECVELLKKNEYLVEKEVEYGKGRMTKKLFKKI